MTDHSHKLALLAAIAAAMLPATAAQAQYGRSYAQPAPLYPYAVQADQPYAIEVAPNTYVIQRNAPARAYPYVRCQNCGAGARNPATEPVAPKFDRPPKPANRALIEELRKRAHNNREKVNREQAKRDQVKGDQVKGDQVKRDQVKRTIINTKKIVHDAPVVIETTRVVDDPPRVIERHHVVNDEPAPSHRKPVAVAERDTNKRASGNDEKARVIRAEAEVTILGPDRMSIRLFRKGHGSKANARAE